MMMWLLLFFVNVIVSNNAFVDIEDFRSAIKSAEDDMNIGWCIAFQVHEYCLTNDSPYTIRISLIKGESQRFLDCSRPWRSMSWFCEEVYDSCKLYNIQKD